ncbi:MAG: PilZ domain-containing protein [Planctomycetota bacterium]
MDERRQLKRFSLKLKAHYTFEDTQENWKECSIIDITNNGMGVKFHSLESVETGTPIHLAIVIDETLRPVRLKGVIKWGGEGADTSVCGVELTEIMEEVTWNNLIHYIEQ